MIIFLTFWACAYGEDDATISSKSRVSKAPRISSSSLATHPSWPSYAGYSYDAGYGNYDSSFYDPYLPRATHPPMYPGKATHPPFPLKSQKEKENSISSSKKQLLKFDTESVKTWFKDALSYLYSPFLIHSAITKAVKPTSQAMPSTGRNFWSKMIASFKAVLKRNSEEKGQDLLKENVGTLFKRLQERTKLYSILHALSNQKIDPKVTNKN